MQPSHFSGLAVSFSSGELVQNGLFLAMDGHGLVTSYD